ncbi:MAG: hypothetical protein JO342_18415 [Solirubrobacterales bacterium]|nr:hypothetical protein [Solirubrobacterales bacterium]
MRVRANPDVSEGRAWREYFLHVPVGYAGSAPTPLVVYFHGAGGSAAGAATRSGWSRLADHDRFLVAYPQGLPFGQGGPAAWASAGPIDYGIDDLTFVRSLLAQVERRFCVARGAVFASGMSSGGGMAGYLACALSTQIAAIAPVAGNHYTLTILGCRPRRPVALLEVHGTADGVVPYRGIPAGLSPEWPLPSIPIWVAAWARLDHCQLRPAETKVAADQTLFTYRRCAPGAGVELYRLQGGGHSYPATLGGHATDAVIYRYFMSHVRGRVARGG